MKKFMMIFIGADYQELGLLPDQLQDRMGKWFGWNDKKMEAQGILKGGNALVAVAKRVSNPDRTITDSPFVERKELVGDYYIISAENTVAVVKIADDYPDYNLEKDYLIKRKVVLKSL